MSLYKKKDRLNIENYQLYVHERIMHDQLSEHCDKVFNPFLAAFRKGFRCQTALLRLLED